MKKLKAKDKVKYIYVFKHEYGILGTPYFETKELCVVKRKRTIRYLKKIYKRLSGFNEFDVSCFKTEKLFLHDYLHFNYKKIYLVTKILFENDEITHYKYIGAYADKEKIDSKFFEYPYYVDETPIGVLFWRDGFVEVD